MNRSFCFALALASIGFYASSVNAEEESASSTEPVWSYTLFSGKITITGVEQAEGDIEIPSEIEIQEVAYPVTAIAASALKDQTNITAVTVPTSVTSIGSGAFSGCSSITNMVLPFVGSQRGGSNRATGLFGYVFGASSYDGAISAIQRYSDYGNLWNYRAIYYLPSNLTHVVITDDNKLCYGAFGNCSMLEKIVLPSSITNINDYAFGNGDCTNLKGVYFENLAALAKIDFNSTSGHPNAFSISPYVDGNIISDELILDDTIEKIGAYAFYKFTSITNLVLSDSVKTIGDRAFESCANLGKVSFGASIERVGRYAFYNSNLRRIDISDLSAWCSISWTDWALPEYELYVNGNPIGDASIPDDISQINSYAFCNCTNLTGITINDNVTNIGAYAFYNCYGLTSAKIGNAVTNISKEAFSYSDALEEVEIGENVKTIGNSAFQKCSKIKNLILPDSVETIDSFAFHSCRLESIVIRTGLKSIGKDAFGYSSSQYSDNRSVKKVYIKDLEAWCKVEFSNYASSPVYAARNLYYYPSGDPIGDLVIPESISEFSSASFRNCTNLTSVVIHGGISNIVSYAFSSCNNITNVVVQDGVQAIDSYAFYYCTSMKTISLPPSLEKCGASAFSSCSSLEGVYSVCPSKA